MTEQEWLASNDPGVMLEYLSRGRLIQAPSVGSHAGPLACCTDRKLRLFACACARQVWERLVDESPCGRCAGQTTRRLPPMVHPMVPVVENDCPDCSGTGRVNRSRRAVEEAERYADGLATEAELDRSWQDCVRGAGYQNMLACLCASPYLSQRVVQVTEFGSIVPPATQAALLRCLFGNPWRPVTLPLGEHLRFDGIEVRSTPTLTCPWFAWNDGTVVKMARRCYDERDWAAMPVLADALEDAGCADEEMLMHCRGMQRCHNCVATPGAVCEVCQLCIFPGWFPSDPDNYHYPHGPHGRGCWVLDLLLGKE